MKSVKEKMKELWICHASYFTTRTTNIRVLEYKQKVTYAINNSPLVIFWDEWLEIFAKS